VSTGLTLGEYIRRKRREKGINLMDLAKEASVSYTHLSRIEADSTLPKADTVARIAGALDADLKQMLELSGSLPKTILDRIAGTTASNAPAMKRAAYRGKDCDPGATARGPVYEVARQYGLDELEAAEAADAFRILCSLQSEQLQHLLGLIKTLYSEGDDSTG
jgi:transcriptional regulator with XRE-family HTH domain